MLAGACLVAAYLVASILAAPFHDVLSARVERLATGNLDDRSTPGAGGVVRDALRSVREELRRLRRENRRLREEREILKKAAAWFARETDSIPPKSSKS